MASVAKYGDVVHVPVLAAFVVVRPVVGFDFVAAIADLATHPRVGFRSHRNAEPESGVRKLSVRHRSQ